MSEMTDVQINMSSSPRSEKSSKQPEVAPDAGDVGELEGSLAGWRYWLTMASLYTAQFLVTLEMSVVTTALVAIANDLRDFTHSTWTANAYFLTWSGFLVLWTQFSHTTGRKNSFLMAFGSFVIFSAGCAAAQTPLQLYILRGLQGIAGAGVFSLPIVIASEAIQPHHFPRYVALVAVNAVVALATGPLIGGAIAARTTWRWVFILNVPFGGLAFLTVLLALPNSFPHHNRPPCDRPSFKISSLKQLDVVGGLLFLGLSILTVAGLQEADSSHDWNSPAIICLLTFGALSAILFVVWERFLTISRPSVMPIITYRFAQRRTMAMFASAFLIGFPFIATMVQIPQRLQVINGFSPLQAAIHLLPYTVLVAFGAILSSILSKGKLQSKPIYGQLFGALLQLAAVIGFTVDPPAASPLDHLPASQYGYQVLMGLGNGFAYGSNSNGIFYSVGGQNELIAPVVGANSQFRYLGAAIGVGSVTAAFNTHLRTQLLSFLSSEEILTILGSSNYVSSLSAENQVRVYNVFATGFVLQWKIMCGFVGLQIVAIMLTY